MIDNMTFADVVAEVDDDANCLTPKGLDRYFDIMEHLANGGSIYDITGVSHEEAVVWLAVGWKQARDSVVFE